MPAGATYEPIATSSPSGVSSVSFSSLGSYTDIKLITFARTTYATTNLTMNIRVNSDTGTNYSRTYLIGDGSTATSGRETSTARIYGIIPGSSQSSGIFGFGEYDFFNYSGSTQKTILGKISTDYNGSGNVIRQVSMWNSTSAITSIDISIALGNFESGSKFTLYGIKAA